MSRAASSKAPGRLFSVLGFVVTLSIWRWAAHQTGPIWLAALIALAAPALIFPIVGMGRSSLDHDPPLVHAMRVTRIVHFLTMTSMGVALISVAITADQLPWGKFPFPAAIADALTAVAGFAVLLTVINLAARGLGAPWAISLSKRLATDWLYARTRNPMMLCLILFLICFGLHLRSALFLGWIVVVFVPAMAVFLHSYEERELEIRFGPSYRQYRSATPMFFPRLRGARPRPL